MNKEIKSHVQIPKFILKQFENINHQLFYYDFEKDEIKSGHAKSLNTVMGFYSEEIEDFLSSIVEQPFSKFLQKAKPFISGQTVDIDYDDRIAVFTYLYSLISRGSTYFETVKKESVTAFLFSEQEFHDIAVYLGITSLSKEQFFQDSDITLGVNLTNVPFIMPNIGYCETKGTIIMPITPFLAVMIVYKDKERFYENGEHFFAKFDDENSVKNLNMRLFLNEKNNNKYVTATSKEQLNEIVSFLKSSNKI